jgi:hypothetical protein
MKSLLIASATIAAMIASSSSPASAGKEVFQRTKPHVAQTATTQLSSKASQKAQFEMQELMSTYNTSDGVQPKSGKRRRSLAQ